jgi:hypothetical protein
MFKDKKATPADQNEDDMSIICRFTSRISYYSVPTTGKLKRRFAQQIAIRQMAVRFRTIEHRIKNISSGFALEEFL